jgi:ATP-dependent DNA helicase RecQ
MTTPDLLGVLESVFGHARFRSGQERAIHAFLSGSDVTVLMPTGGGKSLCYQLPAVADRCRGTTIVVSPLIALMNDQVEGLRARGVAAGALHSGRDELEQREVIAHLITGKLDLIYVSPERTVLDSFRRLLARSRVARLVIDEAHCISQWGHDFRPEYQRLGELRESLGVPTMALTATATLRVMGEIEASLALRAPERVSGSFTRPNLRFQVRHISKDAERLAAVCEALEAAGLRGLGSGRAIIYCATRKTVEAVAGALKQRGFAAQHYHAGRTDRARQQAQCAFDSGRARVLVATNAFGMGVDHPDVRLIVHFHTPGSVEAYYQEAGRAGRDGLPAECLLLFGLRDLVTQRFLNQKSAGGGQSQSWREHLLAEMEAFARATTCRQQFFVRYFTGEESDACGVCDVCRDPTGVAARAQEATTVKRAPESCAPLTESQRQILVDAVAALKRPVGKSALARALRGSRARALRRPGLLDLEQHGALHDHTEACIAGAIEVLLRDGILERRGVKYPTVWLKGRPVRPPRAETGAAGKPTRRHNKSALQRALESYRQRKARSLSWKRYMVFNNAVLRQITELQPDSIWALEQIHGFGPSKAERFGQDIIELVQRHAE